MTKSSAVHRFHTATEIVKYLGPAWALRRAKWAIQHRLHWWELRTRSRPWDDFSARKLFLDPARNGSAETWEANRDPAVRFLFDSHNVSDFPPLARQWDAQSPATRHAVTAAEAMCQGKLLFFGHLLFDVGSPPQWHRNPRTHERLAEDRHWSRIADFGQGDIKLVWETSRFSWAYSLVRAYWRTGDERWPELFWSWLEDWQHGNSPYQGAQWKCGQEISLRLMAWVFAMFGFATSTTSTPARRYRLARMVAIAARRVDAHVDYALSQRNNHGISEGIGLWTAGLLFPELRDARRWEARGRKILERLARDLIYDDGSFSQYSWNYHRVMLQLYSWAIALSQTNRRPFSDELRQRVALAAELAGQFIDEPTGEMPVFGQNDGALVLPLSNCDATDHRAAIQATCFLTTGRRRFKPGIWDEELCWLAGTDALATEAETTRQPAALHSSVNGYVALRGDNIAVFSRCGPFLDRPSQADVLHTDVRWRHHPIAIDPGTYSYNAAVPWNNPFAETRYHNTITVNGRDQMRRASRFLWLPWLRGKSSPPVHSSTHQLIYWQGTHDGYGNTASYRREIAVVGPDCCVVVDHLSSRELNQYRLHWLLEDYAHHWDEQGCLTVNTPSGEFSLAMHVVGATARFERTRGDGKTPRGWRAKYYGQRAPAISVSCAAEGSNVSFWTVFAPSSYRLHWEAMSLGAETGDGQLRLAWKGDPPGLATLQWHEEQLQLEDSHVARQQDRT